MKNKKRLLFLIMLSFIIFTSCIEKYGLNKKSPVIITVWHYYNGGQKELFDSLVKEFNETIGLKEGIIVEGYSQGSVSELQEKVIKSIEKNTKIATTPDIFAAYADTAYTINSLDLLADIGKYMTKKEQEEYLVPYIEEGIFEDNKTLKIFPVAKSTEAFFLNKTAWKEFSDATGASESSFQTWEGIAKVAKQYYDWTDSLTEEKEDGKAFFGRDAMANYMIIGSLQLGKEIFQIEQNQVIVTLDKEIMRKLWDNYYIPYIYGHYANYGRFRSDDMKTGDLIAYVGSTSGSTFFPTEVTKEDGSIQLIDGQVYPLPNFDGTNPYAVQQGAGMVLVKSEEKKEYAATMFLKWFTQKEQNIMFSIGSGYLPVKKEANKMSEIEIIVEEKQMPISNLVKQTINTGIGIVNTYKLYSTSPFKEGAEAREILNNSLQQKAESDFKEIQRLKKKGVSRKKAIAMYNTEANFEQWYQLLKQEMEKIF